MVGMCIPIQVEGEKEYTKINARRGSTSFIKKPIHRKGSRHKLKSINVEIQLEAATSSGTREKSLPKKPSSKPIKKKAADNQITIKENCRKSGISSKNSTANTVSVKSINDVRDVPRIFSRKKSSSKELGLGQTSAGIKKLINRRQSSCKDLLGLDKRRKSCGKVVIRRDSVNGLRIVAKHNDNTDGNSDENEAIEKLIAISLEEVKEFTKFEEDALKYHNKYRKRHSVTPLKLSRELCDVAQEYADHLASTNTFQHSGDPVYGENLYWSWSSDPDWELPGEEPVESWYEERRGYNYDREPRDTESGHFTQLVWSKSLHLGVGVTKSSTTGKYIVVMKYSPAGNYLGQYRDNVTRPGQGWSGGKNRTGQDT